MGNLKYPFEFNIHGDLVDANGVPVTNENGALKKFIEDLIKVGSRSSAYVDDFDDSIKYVYKGAVK